MSERDREKNSSMKIQKERGSKAKGEGERKKENGEN